MPPKFRCKKRHAPGRATQHCAAVGRPIQTIYLLNLADKLGVDTIEAAREKLAKNRAKYPAHRVRGRSLKYDEYD